LTGFKAISLQKNCHPDRSVAQWRDLRFLSGFPRILQKTIAPLLLILLVAILRPPVLAAQLSLQTDSVAPERFVAAHGRKAIVMGYASGGLELWAYPLQLISGYELGFRPAGDTTETAASLVLRRVTYDPEAITRTYIGPDFIVRERLFVPLNEQAILLTYTVECRHNIDIVIHFTPVLDLMWPASLGGQSTQWNAAASAYILSEPLRRYSAFIGSPQVISHDEVLNSAQPGTPGNRFAFAVRAGGNSDHSVTVVVARNDEGSSTAPARMRDLLAAQAKFETEARNHYAELLNSTLQIETPDNSVNQQLAWAQIALDQAWVCNPVLGCGLVAGYGPSRAGRRPQYAWFFGGDGLIAIEALVNTGAYDRAREALAFIAKYQDAATGMIWHELSQSADPADWATRYPYMFVHVDITFQYLTVVESYVSASGDTEFLQQHWPGIESAYRYCTSLIDAGDGLPRIPSTKEGGDEQDKMTDDSGLASSWVAASAAFARMARLDGHVPQAEEAAQLSEKARSAAARRYWDEARNTWIDGYNVAGRAVSRHGDSGVPLIAAHILDQRRSDAMLDQLATSDFETDWGTRGLASNSPEFDPASYSKGSVSPVGTARVASEFWANHRPFTAFPIWSGLLPWGTLDSMGHIHELLTGDFYHQQVESVPEQTWSSAALLSSAVEGLLGLERDAHTNGFKFSPHLPANWDHISVRNLKVPGGNMAMTLTRVRNGLELKIENSGSPVDLLWAPEIPLGAHLSGAQLNDKPVHPQTEEHAQDTHATMKLTVPHGTSSCLIRYEGGVLLSLRGAAPLLGEPSQGIKITSVVYKPASLVVDADVSRDAPNSIIELRTGQKVLHVRGAKLSPISDGVDDLLVDPASNPGPAPGRYGHVQIVVDLAGNEPAP
jgi:glycogen debranching enzyme